MTDASRSDQTSNNKEGESAWLESAFKKAFVFGPALAKRAAYVKAALFVLLVWKPLFIGSWFLFDAVPESSAWHGPFFLLSVFCGFGYFFSGCTVIARRLGVTDGVFLSLVFLGLCWVVIDPYTDAFLDEFATAPLHWLLQGIALLAFLLYPNRWTQWVDGKMSWFREKGV